MNVEEKVKRETWFVLKKIKEAALKTRSGAPVEYWAGNPLFFGEKGPTPSDEGKILEKLEEMGVLKIYNPGGTGEYE
jgi:hypothetical protein